MAPETGVDSASDLALKIVLQRLARKYMNEPLHSEIDAPNKSSMTLTLSTDENIEDSISEQSFPESSHSVENLLLRSAEHGVQDSNDLALSHLEIQALDSDQKASVVHASFCNNTSSNTSIREDTDTNITPQIFNNIEIIGEIHRKAQTTLFKCLQRENSFLRAAALSRNKSFDKIPNSEIQVVVPGEITALSDCSKSLTPLQVSMTKSALFEALQEQLKSLTVSTNLYKQRAEEAEEQRRLAIADLNKETGKLKMLEQVVIDKDAELHRLLEENLEASRFITTTSKGIQQSPIASMSTSTQLSRSSTTLDKQLEAVTRYSSKIEDKLRSTETELKLYKDSIEEKDKKILELSSLVQKKTSEMEVIKEQLLSTEDLLKDQEGAAANYKSLIKDKSHALEKVTLLLNSKTNELDVAMRLASEIQKDTAGIALTLTSKEKKITELESQLSKVTKESRDLKVLQLTVASQERQLRINDESISNLEAQIVAKDNLIRTLTSTVDSRDASIKDLEQRIATMQSSASSSSIAIISAEKQSLEHKQYINQLKEEINTYKENLQKQCDENTLLKRKLDEIDQLEEQRLKQTSQLIISYKRKEDDLSTVLHALSDFEKRYNDVALLAAERDTEVQHLKQIILEKDAEVVDLVARNGITQLEASQLQTELSVLRRLEEEYMQYSAIYELFREHISNISQVFSISRSIEDFLSSTLPQINITDSNSNSSLTMAPINELIANIVEFMKKIQVDSTQSKPITDIKCKSHIDACVNTTSDNTMQQTDQTPYTTEDKEVQCNTPVITYMQNNSELERLSSIINEKDKELVSLRSTIISKNEQIRRLLEDDEY